MSSAPERDPSGGRSVGLLAVVVVTLLIGVGLPVGYLVWQKYDPFVNRRPANRESRELMEAARKRPLTDEEFGRAVGLVNSTEAIAQLSAMATVQLEAGRDLARREAALAALVKCQQTAADPDVARSAGITIARMKLPPEPAATPPTTKGP